MDMATSTSLPQTGDVYGNEVVTRKGIRTADFVCGTCLLSFPTLSALKRHNTISHGQQVPNRQDFSRHKFGHLGMPTCHYCRREFQGWSHLERRIQLSRTLSRQLNLQIPCSCPCLNALNFFRCFPMDGRLYFRKRTSAISCSRHVCCVISGLRTASR